MTLPAEIPNIGLKLGGDFLSSANAGIDLLGNLRKSAVYFEYQAPVIRLDDFARLRMLAPQKLRPHGVRLSLASPRRPTPSILKLLQAECALTKTPYLAEHIGVLNPNPFGPSFGYLIAPALNTKTLRAVVENVRILQEACGVPVALENPVFYVPTRECTMDWSEFILALSEKLPPTTGWLIDYVHLTVMVNNASKVSIHDQLRAYAETGRPIFEMHLAGIKQDSFGVFHDDHSVAPTATAIRNFVSDYQYARLYPQNITIEHDFAAEGDQAALDEAIATLREQIQRPAAAQSRAPLSERNTLPALQTRRSRERAGRLRILERTLRRQLSDLVEKDFGALAAAYNYSSFLELVDDFWSNPNSDHFRASLPYFSAGSWDGVDLTAPLLEFLRSRPNPSKKSQSLFRELLIQIATRQVAIAAQRGDGQEAYVALSEACSPLEAGTYRFYVDEEENIAAEKCPPLEEIITTVPRPIILSEEGVKTCRRKSRRPSRPRALQRSSSRKAPRPPRSVPAKRRTEQQNKSEARRSAR